jgi:hypothetical protein
MLLECKADTKTHFLVWYAASKGKNWLTFFWNVGTCLTGDIADSSEHSVFSNTSRVPWLRRLVASLSPRSAGFHSGQYNHKLSSTSDIKTGVSPWTSGFLFSITPPMLQTHLRLHAALTRKTNGRILGAFREQWSCGSRTDFHLAFRGLKQISTGRNGKWTWDKQHVVWREMDLR